MIHENIPKTDKIELEISNLDQLPVYLPDKYKEKYKGLTVNEIKEKARIENHRSIIMGRDINFNFYSELVEFHVIESKTVPFGFYLKNLSNISVRDIYIEIEIQKDKAYKIHRNFPSRPSPISSMLSGNVNVQYFTGSTQFSKAENEEKYLYTIKINALQPKRVIDFRDEIHIMFNESKNVEIIVKMYADCFPDPHVTTMKIIPQINKRVIDAIEFLKEYQVSRDINLN